MKKQFITCLLAVAALLPAALSAQPASWAAHHFYSGTPGENAVIRNWNVHYVVAAYRVANKQNLALWRVRGFASNVPGAIMNCDLHTIEISDSLDIKDFRIVGDTLVFCGTWISYPAFGWCKLDTSCPPMNMHIYPFASPIASLDRLAVYREGSGFHMVAIGGDIPNNFSYIVEVRNVFPGTVQVLTAQMNSISSTVRDQLDDVEALDDRVVIVGRDTRAGNDIVSVRATKKTDGVVTSPDLPTQYRVPLYGRTATAPVLVSRSEEAPHFGIACRWEIPDIDYKLRLYNMSFSGSGALQLHNTQDADAQRGDTLKEMAPFYDRWMLPLVQCIGGTSRIVPLNLSATAVYSTQVFTQPGLHLRSIDRLTPDAFMAWGDTYNIFLQKSPASPSSTCIGIEGTTPTPVDNTGIIRVTDKPTTSLYTATAIIMGKNWWPRTIFLDCSKTY